MVIKSYENYRSGLRSAVRAFWSGVWNWFEFHEGLTQAIRMQFPLAWREGLELAGITTEEMTTEERVRLEQEITREIGYIPPFADSVEKNSRANGGKLQPLLSRADRWAATYNRIRDLALTYAQNDPNLEWVIDAPKESCPSCKKLNGKVKRASYWREKGVYPRCWECLICRGGCKCSFQVTTKRASPGPLPMLP